MQLTFLGATETVTGSKYLLEDGRRKILIDCGLFQGQKELRLRNWKNIPLDYKNLDAVLLTHAHIDHSGYIPKLAQGGFEGPVYCSPATLDLCKIMLPDCGYLQEEDAESANRHGWSKHHPALPLYSRKDAESCLRLFKPVSLGFRHFLDDELSFTLSRSGHILGSCFIRVESGDGTSILFSGDIGRLYNPVMKPPAKIQEADYIVLESTYGDKLHDRDDPADDLARIICETAARSGSVIIPSFAVGRAQSILHCLYVLKKKKRIPDIPVYLDSPMAINATGLLEKHMNEHRLSPEECAAVCNIATYTRTPEESKAINQSNNMPKIIISASGMATGGRILHHLMHYIGDERHTILFPGFQADGTRGDRLVRGEKEIKIHGSLWPVRARIEKLDNMSAHADYAEILSWLENFENPPRKVFITHGEPAAAKALKEKVERKFGWECIIPIYGYSEDL